MGQIQKAAVIGAGLMGTGIAHAFAVSGYDVQLIDVNAAASQKALAEIRGIVDAGVRLNKISASDAGATLRATSLHGGYAALAVLRRAA